MKKLKLSRQFWIRLVAVLLIVLLGVVMYHVGKQHFILVDNKTVGDYKALQSVIVTVDKEEGLELTPRVREEVEVMGQSHKLTVTWTDRNWEEHTIEKKITLPIGELYMLLSVPYLVNDPDSPQEEWLTHFESLAVDTSETADDQVVTDEFGGMSGF